MFTNHGHAGVVRAFRHFLRQHGEALPPAFFDTLVATSEQGDWSALTNGTEDLLAGAVELDLGLARDATLTILGEMALICSIGRFSGKFDRWTAIMACASSELRGDSMAAPTVDPAHTTIVPEPVEPSAPAIPPI